MAIKRTTFLYEILLRFDADGFVGAHAVDLERVADGKEVISDRELPARPLTADELRELVGSKSADLIAAAEDARALAVAEKARADEAQSKVDTVVANAAALAQSLQELG